MYCMYDAFKIIKLLIILTDRKTTTEEGSSLCRLSPLICIYHLYGMYDTIKILNVLLMILTDEKTTTEEKVVHYVYSPL